MALYGLTEQELDWLQSGVARTGTKGKQRCRKRHAPPHAFGLPADASVQVSDCAPMCRRAISTPVICGRYAGSVSMTGRLSVIRTLN